eukprot:XP_001690289.1 predicted protein [Chlamydomonas reinhardtii]
MSCLPCQGAAAGGPPKPRAAKSILDTYQPAPLGEDFEPDSPSAPVTEQPERFSYAYTDHSHGAALGNSVPAGVRAQAPRRTNVSTTAKPAAVAAASPGAKQQGDGDEDDKYETYDADELEEASDDVDEEPGLNCRHCQAGEHAGACSSATVPATSGTAALSPGFGLRYGSSTFMNTTTIIDEPAGVASSQGRGSSIGASARGPAASAAPGAAATSSGAGIRGIGPAAAGRQHGTGSELMESLGRLSLLASGGTAAGPGSAVPVDRVKRYQQLAAEWGSNRFLNKAGGAGKGTSRKPVNFHSHFASLHAAEEAERQRVLKETRAKTKKELGGAQDAPTANRHRQKQRALNLVGEATIIRRADQGADRESAVSGDRIERLRHRLKPREQAIRAGLELQRVVVPAMIKWQRQTQARAAQFLQVEDELGERELQRRLGQLAAFAEAARAMDACFLALKGRISLPYRRALLNAYDTVIDEDVPDLMAVNELEDRGAYEMPEWLAWECGVPVTLDFQLMGHIWADAAAYYALFAMSASNPDRDEYGLRMGDECFVGPLEDKAAKLLLPSYPRHVPLSDPAVQRGTWLVLASLQRLAAWARFPLVVRSLQGMMRKAGIARLDPNLAPLDARVVLEGTPFLPTAAAGAAAAADAAARVPPQGAEAAAGEAQASGSGAAAAPAASVLSPMEALLAALAKEQPDCMVCLQEWGQDLTVNQTNFLSCTVLSAAGPFHAICNTCWNSLTEPKCPMCNKFDLEALSPTEFLSALSTGRHAA